MNAELLAIRDKLKDDILQLKNEIAGLKSEREVAEREWKLVEETVSAARKEIKDYEVLQVELVESTNAYVKEKDEVLSKGAEVVQGLKDVIDMYTKFVFELSDMVAERSDQLTILEQKKEELHKEITKENEELSKNKSDLDIYKKRLEKKYKELMPGQKIIL